MFTVQKKSIFSLKEKITYRVLVGMYSFLLFYYIYWWFKPSHIPVNWSSPMHIFDYLIFGLLSFVVFIGSLSKIGSWFALWFASKPRSVKAKRGLKVALLTCFVPGSEPVEMLEQTLIAMKKVRYPHDTWVLDEGGSLEVKKLCRDLEVKHFSRTGIAKYNQEEGLYRAKTKAGNHNAWRDLHDDKYDIVAQIDMDHIPQLDFFEKTLGYFNDPKVGFVGTPQFYKNTDNWIAKGAAEQSYFFQGQMQQGFYGSDMPFLIGTSHIYSTKAMNDIDGYAPTIVEDHLTGMKFYEKGWKGVYVPEILAKGEGPLNWVDYFNQQMRWSYGLFEIFFKHTPKIIWKLKFRQQINYFLAQLYYFTGVAVVVGMILSFLYLVFGIRAANMNLYEWLRFAVPPYLLANGILLYVHRFSIDPENEPVFGVLGMFLNLGANIIYALAFVNFIFGKKLKYMVTQKGRAGEMQRVPAKTFALHILAILLMVFSLVVSFVNGHQAIQLRFWAIFNIVTLVAVVLSIYWDGFYNYLKLNNFAYHITKYSISAVFGILVFGLTIITYSQGAKVVEAFFEETVSWQADIIPQMAGKIFIPTKGALLGISLYQHNDTNALNLIQMQVEKKFAIVGYYQAWGVSENKFDKNWAENISKNGSIPLITWEPWKPAGGYDRSEKVVDQKEYHLKNIIDGKFDNYISKYAQDIKSYKRPVMIRFAHEMNGNWYPWGSAFNKSEEYVLAFRHVHEIFDKTGATNVTWVWSPNEAYFEEKVPNSDNIELFYPGDDYVDWVGFSTFNWAGLYKNNRWRDPNDLYTPTLKKLKKYHKPIIITETAAAESIGNKALKAKWISKLTKYIEDHSEIKAIVWFNTKDNGVDWTINSSELSAKSFRESFKDYFIQGQ